MPEASYDVFISYASPDLAFAEETHRRLSAAGFRVWFDKARLNPGCDWHREIEAGCEASRIVLPVLTPRWKLSEWTKFETYGAEAVIPLIVEGDPYETFTPPLARFQGEAIDLANAAFDDGKWERLIDAIRRSLARPQPDKLQRLSDVRYRANPYFVGRERELNEIHEGLHQNPTTVLTQGQVRAIAALGGVGKTTLARQYLEKFWRCYPQIFWIDCRLGVENEFARLCDLLLPEHRAVTEVPAKAQLALHTLESRDDRMLVMDNAEDETSIQHWIPKSGHCRTLITSRFAGWSAAVKTFHLYVLEPDPAHKLLATRAGHDSFDALSEAEQTACAALAKTLGYLPLALEQAAAYIEQQGAGYRFADYARLYEAAQAELLAEHALGSTEYPDPVITTWKATAAKLAPGARAILRLCSFLDSTPLPLSVLIDGVDFLRQEAAAVSGQPEPEISHAESWVRRKVKHLRAYSMVDADGQSIALHPLVQTVERLQLDRLEDDTLHRSLAWTSAAFVGDGNDVRTWPRLGPLSGHAVAVARHADQAQIPEPTACLMNNVAQLLIAKAQYSAAEPLMRRALAIDEQSYGPDHPNVATDLNNLALLLQATNRLAEAEPLTRRALAIDEQSYGADHPRVAVQLNSLAALLKGTNRMAEAEPLMRRAVAIFRGSLGDEHPNTRIVATNHRILLEEMKK